MKISKIATATQLTPEGIYTAHIVSISKGDVISAPTSIVITVKLLELDKIQRIYVSTKKETAEDVSIWDRTVYDIYNQLNCTEDADSDDIESCASLFHGKDVWTYCVHNQAQDGKTYTNFYFSKNNKVQAMLAFM